MCERMRAYGCVTCVRLRTVYRCQDTGLAIVGFGVNWWVEDLISQAGEYNYEWCANEFTLICICRDHSAISHTLERSNRSFQKRLIPDTQNRTFPVDLMLLIQPAFRQYQALRYSLRFFRTSYWTAVCPTLAKLTVSQSPNLVSGMVNSTETTFVAL